MEIKIIKNQKGEILLLWLIVLLIFITMGAFILETLKINAEMNRIRLETERALISSITYRWDEVFGGVREGYSAAYDYDEVKNAWEKIINTVEVIPVIQKNLGLSGSSQKVDSTQKGYSYQIKDFSSNTIEVNFKDRTQRLEISGVIKVEVVLSLAAITFEIDIPVKAVYQKLF